MSFAIEDHPKGSLRFVGVMRTALSAVALVLTSGCVSQARDVMQSTTITTEAPEGFRMTEPEILKEKQGARIKGALCWSVVYKARPREVVLTRQSAWGEVNIEKVRLTGVKPSRRRPGCAYYDARTEWTLGSRDLLKVSAYAQ